MKRTMKKKKSLNFKVKSILMSRRAKGGDEYLVEWGDSWVSAEDLIGCQSLVDQFHQKKCQSPPQSSVVRNFAESHRRTVTANDAISILSAIRALKQTNQLTTDDRLKNFLLERFKLSPEDSKELVLNAVKDNIIQCFEVDQNDNRVKTYSIAAEMPTAGHDWYCFECHKPGPVVECVRCWRVFHLKCVLFVNNESSDRFVCQLCSDLEEEVEARIKQKAIEPEKLNKLLLYVYRAMKGNRDLPTLENLDLNIYHKNLLLFQEIHLSDVVTKINSHLYQNTSLFLADVKTAIHCLSLLYSFDLQVVSRAAQVLSVCDRQVAQLRECFDCYGHYNEKRDKNWFCLPCDPPHELVWARGQSFPYWPAKVVEHIPQTGEYVVRFFDKSYDKWTISSADIRPISCTLEELRSKNVSDWLKKPIRQLERHQKLLITSKLSAISSSDGSPDTTSNEMSEVGDVFYDAVEEITTDNLWPVMDKQFDQQMDKLLNHLLSGQSLNKVEVRVKAEEIETQTSVSYRLPQYDKDMKGEDFVRDLDLISSRKLKKDPIFYSKAKYPRNEISQSVYRPGVDMRTAILNLKTIDCLIPKAPKTSQLNPFSRAKTHKDKHWKDVPKEQDFCSPLSKKVIGVCEEYQYK